MSEFTDVIQAVTGAYARVKDAEVELSEAILSLRALEQALVRQEQAVYAHTHPHASATHGIPVRHEGHTPQAVADGIGTRLASDEPGPGFVRLPSGGEWCLDPWKGVGYFRRTEDDDWQAIDLRAVTAAPER